LPLGARGPAPDPGVWFFKLFKKLLALAHISGTQVPLIVNEIVH
jgi:hypothetical protein